MLSTSLRASLIALLLFATVAPNLPAADYKTMDYGPFLAGTYLAPAKNETLKGLAIKLRLATPGEKPEGPLSGGYSNRPKNDIAGAAADEQDLYKTQRFPCPGYRLNVPPGTYNVTLKFNDSWQLQPGKRIFDVVVQGKKVAEKLDLIALVGRDKAHDVVAKDVDASGGQIVIDLVKIKGDPSLAAIVIEGKDFTRKLNCGGGKVGDYAADWPAGYTLPADAALAGMIFDTELLRWSAGWTGGYLQLKGVVFDGGHGSNPGIGGDQIFGTRPAPGWSHGGAWTDPRAIPHGPLPREWAKFRGHFRHLDGTVVSYTVGDCPVLEMGGSETLGAKPALTRTLNLGKWQAPLSLVVADVDGGKIGANRDATGVSLVKDGKATVAVVSGAPKGSKLEATAEGRILLHLPASGAGAKFHIAVANVPEAAIEETFAALAKNKEVRDLALLTKGGPAMWAETVTTQGEVSKDTTSAYVVDRLTLPFNNPYGSWIRSGAFDHFSDGRIAVSTWSGDVWIVSGIDAELKQLTWKRYASGLFHALGLKIVDDVVYVHGRDQLTRLHDLNADGEADFYECFNNDVMITPNFHEFAFDLHTDAEGNFYFIKGGPVRPGGSGWDKIVPHHGCVFRVSKDGAKLEVVARGFRAPNGMGIGPHGEITSGDNEGTWTPAVPLNWIRPGGFYGVPDFSALDPKPVVRDNPLCWMPKDVDNSNGGQVWIPEGQFGPLSGALLHMSYGRCTLYRVLIDEVNGQMQGGVVPLPLKFDTGIMRGRWNAKEGALYICGLRGWQTSASQDGGLYRIRYTGKAFTFPAALHVKPEGIELTFTAPLDKETAADPDNYSINQWNYRWTQNYGSKHYKVSDPKVEGTDEVEIDDAVVSVDGKTVLLKIADLAPVMQMKIGFNLKAADGSPVKQTIHATLNTVGGATGEVHPGEFKVTGK